MPLQDPGERDLDRCFGKHSEQSVAYALKHCMGCRKLKSCVQRGWSGGKVRRDQRMDWWEARSDVRPGRRPPWPSQPPAGL
jgi:hypothetical protein